MKKYVLFSMTIGILLSCSNDDDDLNLESEIIGNWELIEMTGSTPNSETVGDEMEWQETYYLNDDETFLKSRDRDGVITQASGTYDFINNSKGPLLELTFDSESEIIGSCTSNTKETMSIQSGTIFLSSWKNCDGPGLRYKKVN